MERTNLTRQTSAAEEAVTSLQVQKEPTKLFEEDFAVYADRGPNCIDWNDPLE